MFINQYKLVENYRDNESLRNNFYTFTEKVFSGLNFKTWYEMGFWTHLYIPYSLIKNDEIIANVSISKMNLFLNSNPVNGIQFGTVGTLPAYREKGLAKYLMQYVLNEYEIITDLFFLFANETVLNFYPRFGFDRISEFKYILDSDIPKSNYSARKMSIKNSADFMLIKNMLSNRLPLTTIFGASDYEFITMWHLIYVFSDHIYYIEAEDVIVVYSIENNQLYLWDIIFSKQPHIRNLLPKIIPQDKISSIIFNFPPDQLQFPYNHVVEDKESMLFINGQFNLKEKPFKFPTTAQT